MAFLRTKIFFRILCYEKSFQKDESQDQTEQIQQLYSIGYQDEEQREFGAKAELLLQDLRQSN